MPLTKRAKPASASPVLAEPVKAGLVGTAVAPLAGGAGVVTGGAVGSGAVIWLTVGGITFGAGVLATNVLVLVGAGGPLGSKIPPHGSWGACVVSTDDVVVVIAARLASTLAEILAESHSATAIELACETD